MAATDVSIESRARRWAAIDPDPATRSELTGLLDSGDIAGLQGLFSSRITFGTAGIRGRMGPGPGQMNRVVVRHAAAGVAAELLSTVPDARGRGVVVGHDARHRSAAFAADVVQVLQAHGFEVYFFDEPCPTPLVAFAIGYLRTAAGIVVTASHNPAADNGMKVYWDDGAQIVPPIDGRIAAQIESVTEESLASGVDVTAARRSVDRTRNPFGASGADPSESGLGSGSATVHYLGGADTDDPLVREYLRQGLLLRSRETPSTDEVPVRIAATSLHGVGAVLLQRLLFDAGYRDIEVVQRQRLPDPDFPTVTFPNPEEPGTLDLLLALAEGIDADVAIANDPDADRLGAAFRDRYGAWRILRGDELGALLAYRLLAATSGIPDRLLATTVVSSRLTAKMASAAGVSFRETLTGFKWLCRPGLESPSTYQVLLYEEALGFAVGPHARDKDGITAALVLVDLVRDLKSLGSTVWEVLDDLAVGFGAHVQSNSSIRVDELTDGAGEGGWVGRVASIIGGLSASPPESIAGFAVMDSDRPAADVLRYFLADGSRVVVRPSGTEPKVKLYCEAIEEVRNGEAGLARQVASKRLARIDADIRRILLGQR